MPPLYHIAVGLSLGWPIEPHLTAPGAKPVRNFSAGEKRGQPQSASRCGVIPRWGRAAEDQEPAGSSFAAIAVDTSRWRIGLT
jgi:hypothetical protein